MHSQHRGRSVGNAIAEAHHAARVVSPDHQRQAALEERLGSILTAAGREADGQLNRLRSIFAPSKDKRKTAESDVKGKRVVRDVEDEYEGDEGSRAQEELYWFDSTLIWSRLPSTVIRSFSFTTPIKYACWARFELSNVSLAESAEKPPIGVHAQANSTARRGAATQPAPQARPGGFSLAQNQVRMSDQRIRTRTAQRPSYQSTSQASVDTDQPARSNIQSALCIFLHHTLILYFPVSGDEHLVQLPFRVKAVFPLALGLLVQREAEPEDRRYEAQQQRRILLSGHNGRLLLSGADSTDDDIMQGTEGGDAAGGEPELEPIPPPLAFFLCRPFDEFAGFDRVTQVIESHSSVHSLPLSRKVGLQHAGYLNRPPLRVNEFSSPNFPDLPERIIYVSNIRDGSSLPIIITADYGKRCIRIFQYGISGVSLQSVQSVSALMGFDSQIPTQTQTQSQTQPETQGTATESQYSQVDDAVMTQNTAAVDMQSTTAAMSQPSTIRNLGRGRPPPRRAAIVPASGPGGITIGGRVPSSRRHPSLGAHATSQPGNEPAANQASGRVPSSRRQSSLVAHVPVQPGNEAIANQAIGGSQLEPHDGSYAAATIIQQTEAMAHEPGAPIPLPLRPSPGLAHARMAADRDEDEEEGLEGAGDFARTFGGIALLDEIRVQGLDSEAKAERVHAFVTSSEVRPFKGAPVRDGACFLTTAMVWISIPSSNSLVSRVISEIPLHFSDMNSTTQDVGLRARLGFSLRSSEPDSSIAQPAVEASAAYAVRRPQIISSASTAGPGKGLTTTPTCADVVIRVPDGSSHLVLGNPSTGQPTIEIPHSVLPTSPSDAVELRQIPPYFSVQCGLSNRVLDALERTLVGREGPRIRHALLSAKQQVQMATRSNWDLLSDILLGQHPSLDQHATQDSAWTRLSKSKAHLRHQADHAIFRTSKAASAAAATNTAPFNPSQRRSHMAILKVLHLVAQDLLISASRISDELLRISRLVVSLACKLGCLSWAEYWTRIVPATVSNFSARATEGLVLQEGADADVPTVSDVLIAALSGQSGKDLEDSLIDFFIGSIHRDDISVHAVCPNVTRLIRIYRTLGAALADSTLQPDGRARAVVDAMVRDGMKRSEIAALPFGYALPLWEAIRLGQARPDARWSPEALLLVDRSDLVQSREDKAAMALKYTESQLRTLPTTETLDPLSAVLFGADFRLDEVVKMMYTSGVTTIDFPERDEKRTDVEVKDEQSRIYWSVTERIKATTVGKGAFLLMSKPFISTQLWDVPKLCLDLRGEPNALITTWPINKVADFELEWPEFHNGVSAALSIWAEEGQAFESDWIFSHYGAEPSAKHAGFLFGLGLLGRLKSLGRVHAYRYFAPRHGITTIGIVLGLGASFVGTGDPAVRQLMALQIAAFLPDGSAPLNQSMLTQTAAILGMGLTFMGSYHRWTAERLLGQIRVENVQTSDNPMFLRDVYALSSGFALGLVMLGKGRRDAMTDAADRRLISSLVELIEGPQPILFDGETSGFSSKDTSITNIPATIALGLIFLRSNRRDVVSQLLRLPSSVDALEYVRPDTLFTRSLVRSLILWDSVRADSGWMEATLPDYLRTPDVSPPTGEASSSLKISERMRTKLSKFNESMQLAYLNIHAACCLAIGLKWAGSQDLGAAECLLNEYDVLVDVLKQPSTTYFERIRRAALQTAKDLALLSCSLILAGSGHLPLLTRLRLEHGKIETPPSQSVYGSYLSSHLALGFLFLGGGRYTFGTSDGAIACLLIACFPRFPATSSENRMHLQAYRHLWVLAIEPRQVVVAQDVESGVVPSLETVVNLKKDESLKKDERWKIPAGGDVQVEMPKALWRATCLAEGRVKMGDFDLDAGRIAEQVGFLQSLYDLRRTETDAAPLLLSGLGLSWASQGVGKVGSEPLVSGDLVDAMARALRKRAQGVWRDGEVLSARQERGGVQDRRRRTGAEAFARALTGGVVVVDDPRADEAEDARLLNAVFSTSVAPWMWSVLRSFFPRACSLARDQLAAGVDEASAGDVIGRVLEWALEGAKETKIPGSGSKWAVEPYVRDAFVQLALEHAKQSS
ncbi:unnamed protein product [Tilletia laevis]|uniref:Anaphase-promoting complex subunit 1 N-terminal domain-containing protein n=1 Tax=Tilletia caries TaxID=13290 RepID=A0ABN7J6H5_9BASI|nr:unnamed protein product [Tilletia caries]CAD6899624.1 unnamed protein product [Tilletia laevis]CAD6949241.1 unnamed protein product [Tilletia caries]CAD7059610.1 unnamed protein product [Tilletia caries]